ncbi:MAG: GNAT family N-acetyltransferase [Chloroflexota bacterium]|nr:GNAT family N-acetyltransferase [Chloroflexota bacterium]
MHRLRAAALESDNQLLLRPIKETDIRSIVSIDARTSGERKPLYWRSKLSRYLGELGDGADAEGRFLGRVAEVDGKVVGFMIGEIRQWEFGQPACGWITAMGVDPNHRRLGIGRRLLAELLDYYRQENLPDVRTIVEWVDGDLLQFFHSMGFVRGPFVELQKPLCDVAPAG